MAVSLYISTPIGSTLDTLLAAAIAAPGAGPWWSSYRDDDTTFDPLFSAPVTLKAPYSVWRDALGLIRYFDTAPLGTPTFILDPAKACRRIRIDFPANALTDFGALGMAPALKPLYMIGGSDVNVPGGRTVDIPADFFRNALLGVYAFRLPGSFLKANASQPVII